MNRQAIIQKHQVTMDIAIQYAGTAESLFDLCNLNGIGITDDVAAGTLLMVPDVAEIKPYTFLKLRGVKPVTILLNDGQLVGEGIEFWGIEFDFIVN